MTNSALGTKEGFVSDVFGKLPGPAFYALKKAGLITKRSRWIVTDAAKALEFRSCVNCKHLLNLKEVKFGFRVDCALQKVWKGRESEEKLEAGCEKFESKY